MANKSISQLDAGAAVSSTDLFPDVQTAGVGPVKVTAAQIGNYVLGGSGLTSVLPVVRGGTGVTTSTGSGANVLGTTPTFTTSALFPAGTVSAPGISVSGDTNTGIYFPAADTIGFVEGGVEGMRINSAGNVGIGTGSPSALLDLSTTTSTTPVALRLTRGSSSIDAPSSYAAADYGSVLFSQNNGSGGSYIRYLDIISNGGAGFSDGIIRFFTNSSSAAAFERMRIDASGNVGIGSTSTGGMRAYINGGSLFTASPGGYGVGISGALTNGRVGTYGTNTAAVINTYWDDSSLELSAGTSIGYTTGISITARGASTYADTIRFVTRGTGSNEAARIDQSGNLLVGTTTTSYNSTLVVKSSSAISSGNVVFLTKDLNNSDLFFVRTDGAVALGDAVYNNTTSSAANAVVGAGGYVYRSTSSIRYKNSIQSATHGLDAVLSLRPVTFKGNNDGDKVFGGLIAEEVDEVGLSEFVAYDKDGRPDAIHYGNMVSLAFKAIQELAAKVSALEAKQ